MVLQEPNKGAIELVMGRNLEDGVVTINTLSEASGTWVLTRVKTVKRARSG